VGYQPHLLEFLCLLITLPIMPKISFPRIMSVTAVKWVTGLSRRPHKQPAHSTYFCYVLLFTITVKNY
jgi:hypothetical protein